MATQNLKTVSSSEMQRGIVRWARQMIALNAGTPLLATDHIGLSATRGTWAPCFVISSLRWHWPRFGHLFRLCSPIF